MQYLEVFKYLVQYLVFKDYLKLQKVKYFIKYLNALARVFVPTLMITVIVITVITITVIMYMQFYPVIKS